MWRAEGLGTLPNPSPNTLPELFLQLNPREDRVGHRFGVAVAAIRGVGKTQREAGRIAVEVVANLAVDHRHRVAAKVVLELRLLDADQRLELADHVTCKAHVRELHRLVIANVLVERAFDIEHARILEVLLEQQVGEDHAVVLSIAGRIGWVLEVAVLLILAADTDGQDVFPKVRAATVVARLGAEQAQPDTAADQRFLRGIEHVVGAQVILEHSSTELTPNRGTVVTAEGPLFRT